MARNTEMSFKLNIDKTSEIMGKRGIGDGGAVQKLVDSEVMRYMDPYIPFLTGAMRNSMLTYTVPGSGEVNVNTPYAHRRLLSARKNGLRGPNFFERMKADHKKDILRAAASAAGGKFK